MKRITVGRYDRSHPHPPATPDPLGYSAWIEGVRDDDSTWILFIDNNGNPSSYWPVREGDGAVVDDPKIGGAVVLNPRVMQPAFFNFTGQGGIVSTWPNFEDGRQGRVFIQDPRLPIDSDSSDIALRRSVIKEFLHTLLNEVTKDWDDPDPVH